jgi:c-di-GMP-binding flagellar brake protein YcgR
MLEKTFSFWRRFVGADPIAASVPSQNDDRRLWVRYAADLQGNLHVTPDNEAGGILATVRDLSVGGANLHLDRPLDLGQMVTLELPADGDETSSVLACVVRVIANPAQTWSIGCVFARELSPEDLQRFGAQKQASADSDQRTWVRFGCTLQATYRKVSEAVGQKPCPAQILNISASGIGLSVQPSLQAGTLLNVDLLDKQGKYVRTLLACVVHTTRRATGDYALGCNFIRVLSEEELQSLLSA